MCSSEVARLVLGYLSDHGLEETKRVFSKECLDLLHVDLKNDLPNGQQLSLIIEEYFLLKGHDKKVKDADPESVLLLLWKQFDVLVGQLKHATIHDSRKYQAKRGLTAQKARVRQLNRRNWAALQQKNTNKSLFVANPDVSINPTSSSGPVISPQTSPQASETLINRQARPYAIKAHLSHDAVHMPNVGYKEVVPKTPTRNGGPRNTIQQNNVISECIEEVDSSKQSSNELLLYPDQFKSPKRKSVPPKKRTGLSVPVIPTTQQTTRTNTISSVEEDNQLDLKSLVDRILGRPELPEKLAENINRAVEIDGSTSQETTLSTVTENSAHVQSAVVDQNKVEDIVEMMKSDPLFEELFSTFDNFGSSFEDSDAGQANECEPKISSQPSSSAVQSNDCANVALDALLMLASSPISQSGSLDTPVKSNALTVRSSPQVASTSPATVVMSPADLIATKRTSQPIMSHVRQLNFTDFTRHEQSAGNRKTSQDTYSVENISASRAPGFTSKESRTSLVESSESKLATSIFQGQEIYEDRTCEGKCSESKSPQNQCSQSKLSVVMAGGVSSKEDCVSNYEDVVSISDMMPSKEGILDKGNTVSIDERQDDTGQQKSVDNHCGKSKSDNQSDGDRCVKNKGNIVGYKDIARCCEIGDERDTKTTGKDTTSCSERKETSYKESSSRLNLLDDLATNTLLGCQSTNGKHEETQKTLKASQRSDMEVVVKMDEEGCNRSTDVMLCDSSEPRNISTESSEGLTSSTDGFKSYIGGVAQKRTPGKSGKDLVLSADSEKSSKRKLKKKKKSTRMSKKAKLIPHDLDVDKFLSRLHYVQEQNAEELHLNKT